MNLAGHYYHMAVETRTYEEEPCQNLRLGNGQDREAIDLAGHYYHVAVETRAWI